MKPLVVAALAITLGACSSPQKTESTETAAESTSNAPTEGAESESMHEHHKGHHEGAHEHKHGSMQHRFEDAARWSKVFDNPERDTWQKPKEVIEHMAIEPGMTVADIGAGTGYFMPHLSKAVGAEGKVLALDIEPNLVEHMTERAAEAGFENAEARVIQPDDPELEAGSIDRILIVDTWHHIGEREAYSKKLAAALADGGAVYVVDFDPDSERGPSKKHKLASDVVMKELEAAGLTASLLKETLPDQYIVRAAR